MQPSDSAIDRIIDCAEGLFARCGIQSVSLRRITEQAKVNLAAVSYYFGSKENLIAEVFRRRVGQVLVKRQMLRENLAKDCGVRDILRAYLEPIYAVTYDGGITRELLIRAASDKYACIPEDTMVKINQVLEDFVGNLKAHLPFVPERALATRLHWCTSVVLRPALYAQIGGMESLPRNEPGFEEVLNFCSAGVMADYGKAASL